MKNFTSILSMTELKRNLIVTTTLLKIYLNNKHLLENSWNENVWHNYKFLIWDHARFFGCLFRLDIERTYEVWNCTLPDIGITQSDRTNNGEYYVIFYLDRRITAKNFRFSTRFFSHFSYKIRTVKYSVGFF